MDTDLKDLASQLDESLEDLTDALDPLLTSPLSTTASKLPLVDKAKLYVLHVYAIESLLFSYLRLNNITAKDHPVMRELTRVKQYVQKIKDAEDNIARQNGAGMHLDKAAAGRFIKAALSGNDRLDRQQQEKRDAERAEREAREQLQAQAEQEREKERQKEREKVVEKEEKKERKEKRDKKDKSSKSGKSRRG